MRPSYLIRTVLFVTAVCALAGVATDSVAQSLQKTLERKFPEAYCPLPTEFMGTFVSTTGSIRLSFETTNGYDNGPDFVFYQQQLDNIVVLEASVFDANKLEHETCYFDGGINYLNPAFNPVGAVGVVFFDSFNPSTSPCAWDETDGATIDSGEGALKLGTIGLGAVPVTTSVVISGLTPNVPYVIAGDWHARDFLLPDDCGPSEICVLVTVEDLANGCGPVSVESKSWGAVKAMYRK